MIKKSFSLIILFFLLVNSVFAIQIKSAVVEKDDVLTPGGRVYFEVEITNEETVQLTKYDIYYKIFKDDELISYNKVVRDIGTKVSFVDFVSLPIEIKEGEYTSLIEVKKGEELIVFDTNNFIVEKNERDNTWVLLGIIIAGIFIVGILEVIILIKSSHKK